MNVPYFCCGDNFIDATNSFITGGGGGSGDISGGSSGDSLNNYIYLSSSNLIINNSNLDGEIRFKTSSNYPYDFNYDYAVRITKNGKLEVYHVYNLIYPQYTNGWYNVSDELIGLKFNADLQQIEISALGVSVGLIEGQITDLYSLISLLQAALGNTNNGLEYTQDLLHENQVIDANNYNVMKYRDNYNSLFEDYSQILDRTTTWRGALIQDVSSLTSVYGTSIQLLPFAAGIIGSIYGLISLEKSYNLGSNISNVNFNLTPQMRRQMTNSNLQSSLSNFNVFQTNLSNLSIVQGFINSNITTPQFVPSLKSNKIMLGNITTPNSSYQMEMTGDLNLNQLYLNSTSLTSLLNQKQNNITAVSPLYLTTGNIGVSFDSTLINNGGSLGVSIGAESKWAFSGANIYNKALTNVGIGTNSFLNSKLNVIGDIYCSSNINIGISSNISDFDGSFLNVAVNGITTDDEKEKYLLYLVDGSLTLNEPTAADIFMVGAGGYGGTGAGSGGGGAGEVIYYPNFPLPKATMTIQVGTVSTNISSRRSRIFIPSGNTIITALGGGNGGASNFYTTSGGTVSALTPIAGTNDAYISITAGTTLTLSANCSADILVVGGGGGGGYDISGGGGSGAILLATNYTLSTGSYSITVGTGGTGSSTSGTVGGSGGNSSITISGTTYTAVGGGGGGSRVAFSTGTSGANGGSGGGGSHSDSTANNDGGTSTKNTYSGWLSYGNAGGFGKDDYPSGYGSGGGGGAGSAGGNASGNVAGNGGTGINLSSYFGTSVGHQGWFAGGGGGASFAGSGGTNGFGNGGNGLLGGGGNGTAANGLANTGGGGGGAGFGTKGGNGGSGIVIIRFLNYLSISLPTSGGSGGGGAINQIGAASGVKFDEYKSFVQAGLNGSSTTGGNGGSSSSLYNTRYTTNITGTPISVGLGGSGVSSSSPAGPATKSNYGDGGDGNGGSGFQGVVIIRFKKALTNLNLRTIKDNANTGLILNANETSTAHQLRIFPWSDTYTTTGIPTRGWSFRTYDGLANGNDLLSLFSYFGGRVGIKTKNPGAVLDVNGDIQCKTFNIIGNEQYGITCQINNQHATGEASMNVFAGQGTAYGGLSIVYQPSQNLGYISCSKNFRIKTGNDAANSYIHIDNTSGNVGIGMNNPSSKLEVNGTITANNLAATIIYGGEIQANIINNYDGNIVNNKNLFTSNIYVNNFIDCQNKPIYNCSILYGTADIAKEWKAITNYYHKDDQGRDRIYFKNDTTSSPPNHFTLFKSGGTTHSFSDKDDVQYCLLERFGLTTYFEVISGGGYDNVGVLDGVSTGTYVFRKMYLRLSTFTEVHRCFCEDELYTNYNNFINEFVGRIVITKGKIKTALKQPDEPWQILEGKDGITIDDSHPTVELSRKKNDKRVIGVITKRENSKDMENRLVINSLGETAVWIVNTNGNIQAGDLITTSNEIGYGQLQLDSNGLPDEIIRNFTLGKSMIDCNFELDSNEYKCEIIDESRNLRRAFLPIFIYSG